MVLAVLIMGFHAHNEFALVKSMNTKELTKKADSILIGKVVHMESRWNGKRTKIFTHVTIAVEEYIKGTSDAKRITIRIPGGEVGDIAEIVSDVPRFEEGERVLLFLPPSSFPIVGWFQGKYTIERNRVLEKGMPVEVFLNQIKASMKQDQKK